MRILITGSNGQLAREIIKVFQTGGHVTISPAEEELDIRDFSKVSHAVSEIRPDVIINCAAYNDVDKAETEWQEAFLSNGIGVRNLALSSRKVDAVLVHYSSDYVFDGKKSIPYTIADNPNPINKYGISKLLGEKAVLAHAGRYFLIRTSWVFGEGVFSFPQKVLEWASKTKKLRIVDDQISSPSYTVDLANALTNIISTENYGLYHMTNSGWTSRYEWAKFILQLKGWKGEIEPAKTLEFQTPAKRPLYSVLDNFPLKETTGNLLPSWQDATERFIKRII